MWPNAEEMTQLLERARNGDPSAVEALLARHREPLQHMVRSRLDPALHQRLDASDIVQDVMLEASQRLSDYLREPALPFHLWLRQMAHDHVIDAYRKHRKAQRRSLDREQSLAPAAWSDQSSIELAACLRDPELTPASAAMREELQRRLHEMMDRMDAEDREILLMRHVEQLSNQQIAGLLGLTEAAASMRYLRALKKLRVLLDSR